MPLDSLSAATAAPTDTTVIAKLRSALLVLGCWSAVACLFVVPISKPATNICMLLAILGAVLGNGTKTRWRLALRHPVAVGAAAWCGVLFLSALHAVATGGVWKAEGSAVFALFYPLVYGALFGESLVWRRRALLAFGLGVGLVLAISWGQFVGVFPQRAAALLQPSMRYTVFKEYTQQGLTFLLLGGMALAFSISASSPMRRKLLWAVAAFAIVNVVLVLQSRTTYLTLVPLMAYGLWRVLVKQRADVREPRRLRGPLLVGAALLVCVVSMLALPQVQHRLINPTASEFSQYEAQRTPTSTGIRLELWRRTLPIIAAAPLLGHGLGQWEPHYLATIRSLPDYEAFKMGHPHQEALLILSEEGVIGLLIFVALLAGLARYTLRLSPPYRDLYACVLLVYVTAGLANCLWADFSHRHVFILLLACMPFALSRPARVVTVMSP